MIPEQLNLRNFLSHRETELDLRGVHIASLVGDNGAGKSALLEAITWAVWGRARTPYGHDDELFHHGEDLLEVELIFRMAYQGGDERRFRILRRRERQGRRSSASLLDFQVAGDNGWRALNGNTIRETQARIIEQLGLDYDTFVNSAYLRQGHADEFTIQSPANRKRVLSVILGLDQWDRYADRAKDALTEVQTQERDLARRLAEIRQELARRGEYEAALARAEAETRVAAQQLQQAQAALDALIRIQEQVAALQQRLNEVSRQLKEAQNRLQQLQTQRTQHQQQRDTYTRLLQQAHAIEARYADYHAALAAERAWSDKLGQAARLQEQKAQAEQALAREADALREQIRTLEREATRHEKALTAARARIEQDVRERQGQIRSHQERLPRPGFIAALEEVEGQLALTDQIAVELERARTDRQQAQVERAQLLERNRQLKTLMDETRERLDTLAQAAAVCPLCQQPLTPEHRQTLIQQLENAGSHMGKEYRNNAQRIKDLQAHEAALEQQIREHERTLHHRSRLEQQVARMRQQLEQAETAHQRIAALEAEIAELQTRLTAETYGTAERAALTRVQAEIAAVETRLATEAYGAEARARLQQVLAELAQIGYDAVAHQALKKQLSTLRSAEDEYRELEKARVGLQAEEEALKRLEGECATQEQRLAHVQAEQAALGAEHQQLQAQLLQLPEVLQRVQAARQKEAEARQRLGAARQQLAALEVLERRLTEFQEQERALGTRAAILKELREAFGVNGIPAMIIEHTLPLFELEANRLLEQLSGGRMHVRFETQREKKSGGLQETLDIIISDEKGSRPYENYSGGEQFRVNFAIRVALARLLAQRAGVRPRALFVDEGFGSLDADGRQRLVEAVKAVQHDFDLILVITHIEELRDAFPVRIQVVKTENGSMAELL